MDFNWEKKLVVILAHISNVSHILMETIFQ